MVKKTLPTLAKKALGIIFNFIDDNDNYEQAGKKDTRILFLSSLMIITALTALVKRL